jgi:hypothetical protein
MPEHKLANVNIDLNRVPLQRCECGNGTWKVIYLIKKLSALIAPSGKETIVPIQVFACDKCGKLSPLFGNLNDTDEIPNSTGETIGGSIKQDEPTPPVQKPKLYL